MSLADKIESMTTVEFELTWSRAIKETNLSMNSLRVVNLNWETLQEQVVLFLDTWEKENGNS
jgi:hypothetical protein